jgi:hypothetical protein
MLAVLH